MLFRSIERQIQPSANGELIFQSVKQNQVRILPLSEEQVRILKAHQRTQALQKAGWKIDENLVFPNKIGGKLDEKRDRNMFKKLCDSAGVKRYQLYQLRKTAFTNMAQNIDIKTLQALSGHNQITTLMNSYVFPTQESIQRALIELDRLRPKSG